jgi:APA family basic amino acid/polyamine antiporter
MIGSGILLVPAEMARHIGSAGWLLVAWGVAGALTIAGAQCYGELSAMMPHAGGKSGLPPRSVFATLGFSIRLDFILGHRDGHDRRALGKAGLYIT